MSKLPPGGITACRKLRLPLLALAAHKCTLQPDNIMIGLLKLAEENPQGLAPAKLNQVLFAGCRLQLAEQLLSNGVATGELEERSGSYYLTEYGKTDVSNGEAWVNDPASSSWELLCLGGLGGRADGILRPLDGRAKMAAGWRRIDEHVDRDSSAPAIDVWEKIKGKQQLKVTLDDERQGVLLVNEFSEPPTPAEADRVLVRLCLFEVIYTQSANGDWHISSLSYQDKRDEDYAESFEVKPQILDVRGPEPSEWENSLKEAGLMRDEAGKLFCHHEDGQEMDHDKLVVPKYEFDLHGWEIRITDVPLRARNRSEALGWFARSLSEHCGRTVATWGELDNAARSYLKKAGIALPQDSKQDLLLALHEALAVVAVRGDASRLGYLIDFDS